MGDPPRITTYALRKWRVKRHDFQSTSQYTECFISQLEHISILWPGVLFRKRTTHRAVFQCTSWGILLNGYKRCIE